MAGFSQLNISMATSNSNRKKTRKNTALDKCQNEKSSHSDSEMYSCQYQKIKIPNFKQ